MPKRPYASLQDWLERTGTPQITLARLAKISPAYLSRILSRSRRCSVEKALKLSSVTGVPVEKLVEWGKSRRPAIPEQAFKSGVGKCA
jgi:transcriptional regulator with XRE-family HTH domain